MKIKYCLFLSALVPSLSHTMHIKNNETIIKFNGEAKPVFEWIRDDRDNKFGKTPIMIAATSQPFFRKIAIIQTLTTHDFDLIAKGSSFYCKNIKNKNNVKYGAIVIDSDMEHFNKKSAQKISRALQAAYIKKQLDKKNPDRAIELDQTIVVEENNNSILTEKSSSPRFEKSSLSPRFEML